MRRGGGVKGLAIRKKIYVFLTFFLQVEKVPTANKQGGGGVLNGTAIKKIFFFVWLPLNDM